MKTFRMFFPGHPSSSLLGGVLLLARLAIGLMFMNHGMQKLTLCICFRVFGAARQKDGKHHYEAKK